MEFVAYPELHNSCGVSVAGVDIDGDGIAEVVTGQRGVPNAAVSVFDVQNQSLLASFFPHHGASSVTVAVTESPFLTLDSAETACPCTGRSSRRDTMRLLLSEHRRDRSRVALDTLALGEGAREPDAVAATLGALGRVVQDEQASRHGDHPSCCASRAGGQPKIDR